MSSTGEAAIKSKFLVQVTKPTITETTQTKNVHENGPTIKEDQIIESKTQDGDDSTKENLNEDTGEPVTKKAKKVKGQNKARPRTVPKVEAEFRMCKAISRDNGVCRFGDKCKFSHDLKKYVESKPPDLGVVCPHFSKKGKCPYGVECRFGRSHTSDRFENIVDEEKLKKYCQQPPEDMNTLGKEAQILLRKKKYPFPMATKLLKEMGELDKANKPAKITTDNVVPEGINVVSKVSTNEAPHVGENGIAAGVVTDEGAIKLRPCEKKQVDFNNKLYLAPLTTVGNLPFRRICKKYGADITCGEMALSSSLLQGHQSEWALVKRHHTEDVFGVQLCGSHPDMMMRSAELLNKECSLDFIDINLGCPIDLVFKKGEGCAMMGRKGKLQKVVEGMVSVSDVPITVKMRTGIYAGKNTAHQIIPAVREWGASLCTLHGRSREQRYTREADWDYINECAQLAHPMPLFGNGDILSYEDANRRREATGVDGLMIARGALIKPWVFTEIKEQRHWDISSSERFEMLRDYGNYGLDHCGSDSKGVENTRRFMLEWLSFLHRYIPLGVLENPPQRINERPPAYRGRDEMETMMASRNSDDWVKISEMILGPVPTGFQFIPKHKANSYS